MEMEEIAKKLFVTVQELEQSERKLREISVQAFIQQKDKLWVYKEIDKTPYNQILKFHMVSTLSAAFENLNMILK